MSEYIDQLFDNLRRDPFASDPTASTTFELQAQDATEPTAPVGWIAEGVISDVELVDGATLITIVNALPTLPLDAYPAGKVVYLSTDKKLYRTDGSTWTAAVPATDITGTITETQITDSAISTPKLAANAVVAGKIAAGTITGDKIAANTIAAGNIVAATITSAEIASNAITTDKLNANAVTAAKIAAGTITATEISSNAITTDKINANAITTAKIAVGAITATEIATGTITATKIQAGTITATEIANSTITGGKIAGTTITAANITAGTITGTEIANSTITGGKIAGATITDSNITNATITGAKIAAATITDANIGSLNAAKLTAGTISIAASGAVSAISSTNFNVSSTGSVTANDLTIGATTSDTVGNDTSGRIAIVPSTTQSAASLQVQSDTSGNLSVTKNVSSATAAGASVDSTVTTTAAHGFVAGQFVSFSGTTGAAWNLITASLPIQIKTTPLPTTFTVNHYLSLPALTAGGTVTAYKRLNIVAPGGAFVYQSGTTPGLMGSGSLVLGSSLTNLGRGSTATLADGEMGFLTPLDSSTAVKTPRYGSGGSLYSRTGSTDVSTSGDFILGTSNTSTQGDIRFKTGAGGRIGALSATSGNTSIGVYNADRSAYAALVANGFYPAQGSSYMGWSGSNFTFNDTVAVTGAISATGNVTGANQASYVRTDQSTSSTTSIPAGSFQSHSLSWTSTVSAPNVVASAFMTGASTVAMSAVVFGQSNTGATIYLYNLSSAATTVGRRAQGIAVV